MEKFVIIDGNNLIFRAFYALPPLSNFDGEISNAVFGFTNMLVKIIKDIKPKYIAVAFDSHKKTFRHDMYKEYKGTRKPAPTELISQFPILKNMLNTMNVTFVEKAGLEADDLIGCLSREFDTENIIVTADKDCLQLINDNTTVMQPKKGITESVIYDKKMLMEEWGLTPLQIIEYKSLRGDPSDNIPGVKNVGDKTAIDLLLKYGSLDNVYKNIEEIKGKLKERLIEYKDDAYLSKTLATIVTDKKTNIKLKDFEYSFPFNNEVLNLFKRYQFNSLLKRDDLFEKNANTGTVQSTMHNGKLVDKITVIDELTVDSIMRKIQQEKQIYLYLCDRYLSLYFNNKEYVIGFTESLIDKGFEIQSILQKFKDIFESNEIKKVVFDSKELKHYLHTFDISLNGVEFDVVVARYLLNTSGKNNITLTNVIDENLLNNDYSAYNLCMLKDIYSAKIDKLQLNYIYYDVELPLVDVLFNMETDGFKIDLEELKALEIKYEKELKTITENIYGFVGKKFNINSPKQLGEVLFDQMKLDSWNNKKKSTSVQVLNDMIGQHPIIEEILKYRQINKLYTTYIIAFGELINRKTQKIYTIFNQTLTTTGRLSSSEPNLQNIPVRSEEGKNIRKIFIPSSPNGYIVSADYNQIELRLLAIFSGDEQLIKAYNNNVDIHSLTASQIFGVPVEQVTSNQRRAAKAINFGIVYGISDYGLSQQISIPVAQANDYIKKYFMRYPSIEKYMKSNVDYCRENGYVKTMFGRVRYIPEINSTNHNLKSFGERAAMNMPLQGSASDVIKIAMIKVFNALKQGKYKSKLILQVHDELIIDTYKDELEDVKNILKDCMENIVNDKVKLSVNIEYGKNWFEA